MLQKATRKQIAFKMKFVSCELRALSNYNNTSGNCIKPFTRKMSKNKCP